MTKKKNYENMLKNNFENKTQNKFYLVKKIKNVIQKSNKILGKLYGKIQFSYKKKRKN